MPSPLLDFLLWATDGLRPWTGLLSFCGGLLGLAGAAYGIVSKRSAGQARDASKAAQTSSDATLELVQKLVGLLELSRADHDRLWGAYLEKDVFANPERVEAFARRAVEADLLPMREFFRAVEIVEKHRTHRPETDIIRILEGAEAA
ncbi:MAG: hypothetical protein ACJ76P_10040 [Actinomycetota bacterium]